MQVEGIYRINGNQADIGLIEQKVEESECSSSIYQNLCLHIIICLNDSKKLNRDFLLVYQIPVWSWPSWGLECMR